MNKQKDKVIAQSIIKKLGKQGVKHFLENGELPVVKLSSKELKWLKGGKNITPHLQIGLAQELDVPEWC